MATLLQTRTTDTDDDGTGTTGTIHNNAWLQAVYDVIDAYVQSAQRGRADGRITLTASTPVTASDVTAATTIRYTPYKGNVIALYDTGTSTWKLYTFSEITLALGADAANTNYDLWAYNSGGTVTLERLAWAGDTTRATALTTQDGVYVKSGDASRRYLGTYRTTGTVGQTEDSYAKRFVWNYYHRVRRALRVRETTDSWTYTTASFQQANASTANQLAVVVGVAEVALDAHVQGQGSNTNTAVALVVAIGEDSTTTKHASCLTSLATTTLAAAQVCPTATLNTEPGVGYHFYAWLELSTAVGTTTWLGDSGVAIENSGISGAIEG